MKLTIYTYSKEFCYKENKVTDLLNFFNLKSEKT